MINPNRNIFSPTISIKASNGEWTPIGELESVNVEPIEMPTVKPVLSGTIILDDFQAPSVEQLFGMNNNLTITVVKRTTRPGAKPLRSHKKRLVKKWNKKNRITLSETSYKNCTIIGGDFK